MSYRISSICPNGKAHHDSSESGQVAITLARLCIIDLHKDVVIWDAQSGQKYGEHAIANLVREQDRLEARRKAPAIDCDVSMSRNLSAASTSI